VAANAIPVQAADKADNSAVQTQAEFYVEADAGAREWLDSHPSGDPRIIAYDLKRCCGGGRLCTVRIREQSGRDGIGNHATAIMKDGTKFLVDRRAAARLPSRFGLTMRGFGPLRYLDLNLDSEQWGALLYD
jgi:hypothetical protein